ncbi:unnamed protein product, partial [Darwinula stevensoni]
MFDITNTVKILEKGWRDVGFPRLLQHVLSHESPTEQKLHPGTLSTSLESCSFVFGTKPELISPPPEGHNHGGFKCQDSEARSCLAVAAAAYLYSYKSEKKFVVLISDNEIKELFKATLNILHGSTMSEETQIHHPKDYRGCEHFLVMCVGVEDSWVVDGISRAIRTLVIVDGGNHPAAQSRIRLWQEMKRRGFLIEKPGSFSNALASLSDNHWNTLYQKRPSLKLVGEYMKCLGFVEGGLIEVSNFTVDGSEI